MVLSQISSRALDKYQITCLVRDAGKVDVVTSAFPAVRIVQGSLDDTDLVEDEAKNADIVLSMSIFHWCPIC